MDLEVDTDANMHLAEDVLTAVVDRITTPRGGLWYSDAYGDDVRRHVGTTQHVLVIAQGLEAQALADERVENAAAQATFGDDGAMSIAMSIESSDGPFEFTLAVDQVSAKLLGVGTP